MKCKKCKKEMEIIDEGLDSKGKFLNTECVCYNCRIYCIAEWDLNKPDKTDWMTYKEYKKRYL